MALPQDAKAEYIEPQGRSFDAQFRRLDQIASQINELGGCDFGPKAVS